MEYILSMTFNTEGGKTTNMSITGVKNDIEEARVLALMDIIIEKNIFLVDSGSLISKNSTKLTQRVVIKFKTEEEVIAMANDSDYGLGGGVFTTNLNRAIRVDRGIRTGRVWVNTYNTFPAGATFGGYKESGIGRETHKTILEAYTQEKNIIVNFVLLHKTI